MVYSKLDKPCDNWEPSQEPPDSHTVCYYCGWLKKDHTEFRRSECML